VCVPEDFPGVSFFGVILAALPVRAADGDLDLDYVPDAAYPADAHGLGVIDGQYYFSHPLEPDGRLLEDGRLDPDWSLEEPFVNFITELRQTPSGGWLFSYWTDVYLNTGLETSQWIGISFPWAVRNSDFSRRRTARW
jgi:hypothetical protein